ncbi:profilin [Mycena epipterygia]|nr:profilin [Mycena epipterygia]
MSWQAYVDTNLIGTGMITKAAILGQSGGVWAASAGYELSAEEQKAAVSAFSNIDAVQTSGLKLHGTKFFTVSANERSIYGKKGGDGCVLVKTTQAVLVGEYAMPVQTQEAVKVVETLADYLIQNKF